MGFFCNSIILSTNGTSTMSTMSIPVNSILVLRKILTCSGSSFEFFMFGIDASINDINSNAFSRIGRINILGRICLSVRNSSQSPRHIFLYLHSFHNSIFFNRKNTFIIPQGFNLVIT
eukprot:NODE_148_length_15570_cov_0.950100.p11 type:complete len:118 gc:universal NODE_148_length_15570_cov_0.950100:2126-1773(-)